MKEENAPSAADEKQVCLNSLKTHWSEAQIDGPMQAIARYDDVAKLLITIGGFVLAVLAGAYSAMIKDLRGVDLSKARSWSLWIFVSMLVFFVSAAAVCYRQPKMWVKEILAAVDDDTLTQSITNWCDDIHLVVRTKKIFLTIATGSFIVSFLWIMWLFLHLLSLPRQ